MRMFKLFVLLAALTAAVGAVAQAQDQPPYNLDAILQPAAGGPETGSGDVKFRQPGNPERIVFLKVRVRGLLPNHSYRLQRATDRTVDDDCTTATNWLTLGRGPDPQAIETDDRGDGRAALWRDLSAVDSGTQLDIHFRVVDDDNQTVAVLESPCYQFTVR